MRKLFITIAFCFICLYLIAQKQKPNSFTMRALPAASKQLTEQQYKQFSEKEFNKRQLSVKLERNFFKKDNILFAYWYLSDNPPFKKSLEQRQKSMSSIYNGSSYEFRSSKIISFNNIRFLIINYKQLNNYYTSFSSDYNQNNEFLAGELEYKSTDEDNAMKLLQEFLESVQK